MPDWIKYSRKLYELNDWDDNLLCAALGAACCEDCLTACQRRRHYCCDAGRELRQKTANTSFNVRGGWPTIHWWAFELVSIKWSAARECSVLFAFVVFEGFWAPQFTLSLHLAPSDIKVMTIPLNLMNQKHRILTTLPAATKLYLLVSEINFCKKVIWSKWIQGTDWTASKETTVSPPSVTGDDKGTCLMVGRRLCTHFSRFRTRVLLSIHLVDRKSVV